ncbi:MAG: hypothetical protein ACOZCO_10550 [Bacteroidota bacterium]
MNETFDEKMKKIEEDFFTLLRNCIGALNQKFNPAPKPPVRDENSLHIIVTVDERKKS